VAAELGMGNPGQILLPYLITEKGHLQKLVRDGANGRMRAFAIPLNKWRLEEDDETSTAPEDVF